MFGDNTFHMAKNNPEYNAENGKEEECAHPSCVCAAAKDSKFCSTFCEGATDHPDITCNCGHAGCTAVPGAGTNRREPMQDEELLVVEILS
jgi:hypothetical protein